MNPKIIDVLDKLETHLGKENVLLAGGAVRDYLMGKPELIKDYDVFLRAQINTPAWGPSKLPTLTIRNIRELFEGCSINDGMKDYGEGNVSKTYIVHWEGMEINLVYVREKWYDLEEFVLQTFDIGLCMCWLNTSTGDFITSPEFMRDDVNRWLTVYIRNDTPVAAAGYSITDHVPRVKAKYPDHEVRIVYK